MASPAVEVYAKIFQDEVAATLKAAKDVAPDARLRQAKAGKAHPLWLVGHLAFAADGIINQVTLGGEAIAPREYRKVFAPDILGGAPIVPDATVYPDWDSVVAMYEKVGNQTVSLIRTVSDEELPGAVRGTPPEPFKDFFKSIEGIFRYMIPHNTYHRGQLSLLANL